jgi:hypothetical protein
MTERLVEIPIERSTREKIKILKGKKTYTEFFEEVIFCMWQFEVKKI